MRIPVVAALALVVALGGCGGGSEASPKPAETTAAKKATASPSPSVSTGTGKPAPQDLASFRCGKDDKGRWNAIAIVSNSAKKAQSYQITVHVGAADGAESPARTQSVGRVNAGGSVTVRVLKIPAAGPDGPCQVQLLASAA